MASSSLQHGDTVGHAQNCDPNAQADYYRNGTYFVDVPLKTPSIKNGEYEKAMSELYGSTPKMAFVIVSKKINTRIFQDANNPRPGTIVDDVITLPERYDFFIVSQFVNQGTVSPTSYNVIHDTLGLDPDKIQRLTFKMTHCYYNWSGTVRVPAPVQYAHKLAFLVSQSLHQAPNVNLSELLYFL